MMFEMLEEICVIKLFCFINLPDIFITFPIILKLTLPISVVSLHKS